MTKILKSLTTVVFLLLLLVIAGCAHMPGGIAPSSTPLQGRKYVDLGATTGTDSVIYLFGLIPLTGSNTTPKALDNAIKSRNGDAMINVTVESYSQWFFIITRTVTTVHGHVIKFQK